ELPRAPLPVGFLRRLDNRRRREASPAPSSFLMPAPLRSAAFALSSLIVALVAYDALKTRLPKVSEQLSGAASAVPESAPAPVPAAPPPAPPPPAAPARGARARGEPILETDGAPPAAPAKKEIAVAAVRGSGGGAAGAYTNEALHEKQEAEKKAMGIRKIL